MNRSLKNVIDKVNKMEKRQLKYDDDKKKGCINEKDSFSGFNVYGVFESVKTFLNEELNKESGMSTSNIPDDLVIEFDQDFKPREEWRCSTPADRDDDEKIEIWQMVGKKMMEAGFIKLDNWFEDFELVPEKRDWKGNKKWRIVFSPKEIISRAKIFYDKKTNK